MLRHLVTGQLASEHAKYRRHCHPYRRHRAAGRTAAARWCARGICLSEPQHADRAFQDPA